MSIAFAWISAPDISSSAPVVEVGWTSWSDGADGPTTTSLSRKVPGGVLPSHDRENEIVWIVPGGP